MGESPLIEKTLHFSVRIVKLYQYLCSVKNEYVLSKQIIRSGTSVGANVNEAYYGQSRADFLSKLQIALKETAETEYWLKVLHLSGIIDDKIFASIADDCLSIKRMLIASIKTAQKNSNKQ